MLLPNKQRSQLMNKYFEETGQISPTSTTATTTTTGSYNGANIAGHFTFNNSSQYGDYPSSYGGAENSYYDEAAENSGNVAGKFKKIKMNAISAAAATAAAVAAAMAQQHNSMKKASSNDEHETAVDDENDLNDSNHSYSSISSAFAAAGMKNNYYTSIPLPLKNIIFKILN